MRLPEDFPHTRREQYVVALPDGIRSHGEHLEAAVVHHRLRLHSIAVRDKALRTLIADGWSEEGILRALRRRLLPHAFWPPEVEGEDVPHRESLLRPEP